jgi:hypothetical protein
MCCQILLDGVPFALKDTHEFSIYGFYLSAPVAISIGYKPGTFCLPSFETDRCRLCGSGGCRSSNCRIGALVAFTN